MPLQDIPLGANHHTLRVNGSTSDWIKPIEDCVYDYLRDQWSIQKPAKEKLKNKNKSFDGNGSHHFWIVRQKTVRMEDSSDGQFWDCVTTLQINVLMRRLSKGEVDDDLDDMCREINRLLIEYGSHTIVGIQYFNNIVEVPKLHHPDDEHNPFENTWISAITVDAHYILVTDFSNPSQPHNPARYSAGVLAYKQDE